jgi:hypothetical protein
MKSVVTLTFSLIISVVVGQKTDFETVKKFWDTNIAEIIRLDQDSIIEHTYFPVSGSWGYVMELEGDAESWTKEDFISAIPSIFNEELRKKLKEENYNNLVHHIDESGNVHLILQLNFETYTSEGIFESTTLLYFKRFDGVWKIYQIEYAG